MVRDGLREEPGVLPEAALPCSVIGRPGRRRRPLAADVTSAALITGQSDLPCDRPGPARPGPGTRELTDEAVAIFERSVAHFCKQMTSQSCSTSGNLGIKHLKLRFPFGNWNKGTLPFGMEQNEPTKQTRLLGSTNQASV